MKEELFQELLEGVRQGGQYLRGRRAPSRVFRCSAPNVRAIRERARLSQESFAALLGISVGTLRNWEQGRRTPEGPARRLLQVAAYDLPAVLGAIHPRPAHARRRRVAGAR